MIGDQRLENLDDLARPHRPAEAGYTRRMSPSMAAKIRAKANRKPAPGRKR